MRNFRYVVIAAYTLAMLVPVVFPALSAATISVPTDHATIQAAIDASLDGDEIIVSAGEYVIDEPIDFLGKSVQLRSADGAKATTIRMLKPIDPDRGAVVIFDLGEGSETLLEGFTLRGGTGLLRETSLPQVDEAIPVGGAIYIGVDSRPTVRACRLVENVAGGGGGAFADVGARPLFEEVVFLRNRALRVGGGGLMASESSLVTIHDSLFESNESEWVGGGVAAVDDSALIVKNTRFASNTGVDGCGLWSRASFIAVTNSAFLRNGPSSNVLWNNGGGAFAETDDPSETLLFRGCNFESNRASRGGALHVESSNDGFRPAKITECTFVENEAWEGGGLAIATQSSLVLLRSCAFRGNFADSSGGGMYVGDGTEVHLIESVVVDNTAYRGGAVYGELDDQDVEFKVIRSTIAHNAAARGGGFQVWGRILLDSSILAYNSSRDLGIGDELTILNSCIPGYTNTPHKKQGLINDDPLFVGWESGPDVFVDASAEPGGDGSEARPWKDLRSAIRGYRVALTENSPCIGTGTDGVTMGAPLEVLNSARQPMRRVHVASGDYSMRHVNATDLSLLGMGAETTRIEGSVIGLWRDHQIRDLEIHNGLCSGIIAGEGTPLIANCVIRSNFQDREGGGISLTFFSRALIEDCDIVGNMANRGGGVMSWGGNFTIRDSKIRGNRARSAAIAVDNAEVVATNCLIVGNSGIGGHIFDPDIDNIRLVHCTVANNGENSGCALRGAIESESSIFWANDRACGTSDGSIENVDPVFVREGEFDFERYFPAVDQLDTPVRSLPNFIIDPGDYRLGRGSPALDAVDGKSTTSTDLDGVLRPCGEWFDLGAFESGDCGSDGGLPFVRGDVNQDSQLDISDAIGVLRFLFLTEVAIDCLKAADTDDNQSVEITDAILVLSHLFTGRAGPEAPYPLCSHDRTPDAIPCTSFSACP